MRHILAIAFVVFATTSCLKADADKDWAYIISLDVGPKKKPSSREEAQFIVHNYLDVQRKAIEVFLAKYPRDPHAFDAKLKLAAILATIGMMENNNGEVTEAMHILIALENEPSASVKQRIDAHFQRICLYMQTMRGHEQEGRDNIVAAVRDFSSTYPEDPRSARLLVEVATICDNDPSLKRDLLEQAQTITHEDSLKQRINDDFIRLNHLGKPLNLKFETFDGTTFDIASQKGNIVVLIFWSSESMPSLIWIEELQKKLEKLPKKELRVATISLDTNREELKKSMQQLHMTWPTYFDGKGWKNNMAQPLGINALPTVWILDKHGVLRSINAKDDLVACVQKILSEN